MEISADPTRTSALMPLLLALAACSGGGNEPPAQSAALPPNGPSPPPPPPPSALFVLGDSLSDVGNAAAAADYVLNVPLEPPTVGLCNPIDVLALTGRCDDLFYSQSRVSDGPVAVEHLAQHFGLAPLRPSLHVLPNQTHDGTVYAVSGAKARGTADTDFARQVDWLLLDHALVPRDAVYVIMVGGNDAIDALQADVDYPTGSAEAERRHPRRPPSTPSLPRSNACSPSARSASSSRTCPISPRCPAWRVPLREQAATKPRRSRRQMPSRSRSIARSM